MNTLIAVAIEEEVPTLKHEHNVFAVGVGKVNATHALTRLIIEHEPKLVVNYGTAGGVTQYLKGLIECSHFIQWDMNCTKVGFSKFQTPFEPPAWTVIGSGDGMMCGTGDTFVTDTSNIPCDVVDMEAYAMAKVCRNFDVPFRCFKYISDSADEKAGTDWQQFNFADAEKKFIDELKRIDGNEIVL